MEGMRICVDTVRESVDNGTVEVYALFCTEEAVKKYEEYLPVQYFGQIDQSRRFTVSAEVADKMSCEGNSQGVFIIARKLDRKLTAQEIDPQGKYIVLNGLQDPGNLGTLLRTSDAVGVDGVVLSGSCVDMYNPKVVRSAMGSMPRLKIYVEKDLEKVVGIFRQRGVTTAAAVVHGGQSVLKYSFSGGHAVVIGNEGRGLSEEDAQLCDNRVTIEMNGHMDSLNAASAGTIFLWEMTRNRERTCGE